MSTHPSTGDAGFGDVPNLDEVRQRIARAWEVVERKPEFHFDPKRRPERTGGPDVADHLGAWWRERGAPALRGTGTRLGAAAAATGAAARQVLRRSPAPSAAPGVEPEDVEVVADRPGWMRRHPLATALAGLLLAIGGAAAAVPLSGNSEEAIAWAGERFFDVAPLPADLAVPDERSRVYDAGGNQIAVLSGPENRRIVPLEEIPQVVRDAVVATEDARYWSHDGVDAQGIVRAAWTNWRAGEVKQGASTITQQYVKNVLLSSERSFERKITEAVWAVRLEEEMDKDEVLEGYLNVVYLGGGTYGVAAASEYWFGMSVEHLDLTRAALLASLISAPSNVDLANDPASAAPGRAAVLREMVEQGMVTAEEAEAAHAVPVEDIVRITPLPEPEQPMFVRHIVDVLLDDERLGETRDERANLIFGGGLEVTTTLDSRMQQAAVETIPEFVTDPLVDPMAGIVSVVPGDGAIRTLAVGPKGWGPCDGIPAEECETTTVNPLVPGAGSPGRQVGSSFKPILLAAALENDVTTEWHTSTRPGAIDGCPEDYEPDNYDGGSQGTLDMRSALLKSNNVYHVKLGAFVGLETVTEVAADLGIPGLPPYCSLPLGSVETHPVTMAAAYAAFANDGVWCAPYAVAEVRDRRGEVLLRHEPDCERVLSEQTARTLTTLLEENVERGTATRGQIGRPAAAKTGTTNDFRDAWLVGFTPQLATAVWVGHEVPKEMRGILGYRVIAGGTIPAEIWGAYMARAMEPLEALEFERVEIDRWNGGCADRDSFAPGRQGCAPPPAPEPAPKPAPAPAPQPQPEPQPETPQEPTPEGNGGAGGGEGGGEGDTGDVG